MAFTFNCSNRVIKIDKNNNEVVLYPVIPADKLLKNTTFYKETLQYRLFKVSFIVAKIDLNTSSKFLDFNKNYKSKYVKTDNKKEDKYSYSTYRVLTNNYKNKILKFKKRLNAYILKNLKLQFKSNPFIKYTKDIYRLVV